MLLGAVAGGLSAVATHPIDTVKSNMQALGGGAYVGICVRGSGSVVQWGFDSEVGAWGVSGSVHPSTPTYL